MGISWFASKGGAETNSSIALRLLRELWIAVAILLILVMMVYPLPPGVLDFLISANLACAVVILLTSVSVSEPLKLSGFPTLLLLTTLFRLGLNVSSTRLILLEANAGDVIAAFGEFVVQGNYVVGGVIFAILSLIQFIVIAKGGERVAEVGARFALDAMPGKQMAIDAELRGGSIDSATAKKKRSALARESQFYGAMDGAMKFVKGDVLASLLITVINLIGGFLVGVVMNHESAASAAARYSLLTIGDGLVSQLPSLVIATSAGILVTRVASDEPEQGLGGDLLSQFGGVPRAIELAALLLLLGAIAPGLPAIPLLVLGLLLLLGARLARQSIAKKSEQNLSRLGERRPQDGRLGDAPPGEDQFAIEEVAVLELRLGSELVKELKDWTDEKGETRLGIKSIVRALHELLYDRCGLLLDEIRLRKDETLAPRSYGLLLHGLPLLQNHLGKKASDSEAILDLILEQLEKRADELLTIQQTQNLLDRLEESSPALVRSLSPKPYSVALLNDVFWKLLQEGVSIRPLERILHGLAQQAGTERESALLAEIARVQLRPQLSFALSAQQSEIPMILLDHQVEQQIRSSIQRTAQGSYLQMPPRIIKQLQLSLSQLEVPQGTIILCAPDLRRFLKQFLNGLKSDLRIYSFVELNSDIALRNVGIWSPPQND